MSEFKPTDTQQQLINELLQHYQEQQGRIKRMLDSLDGFISGADSLAPLIHSVKKRMKSRDRLEDKLRRKMKLAEDEHVPFEINRENLLTEITDLGGYRVMHLHTRQMEKINPALLSVLQNEAQCIVIEGPKANVWDNESEKYFDSIGIDAEYNPRLYTSVHYVVQPNNRAPLTIEIQVRTLSEEVWGEVDHKFNYPQPVSSVACSEQIKVLARVASSCTRLVDSIFASYADWEESLQNGRRNDVEGPQDAVQSENAADQPPGANE